MKTIITLLFAIACGTVSAQNVEQTTYVDAVKNAVGFSGGTYNHVKLEKGVVYEVSIIDGVAYFNNNDKAQMVDLGVMYVENRQMKIKTVRMGEKIYIATEGNVYLFFVDDPALNSGGLKVRIRKANT